MAVCDRVSRLGGAGLRTGCGGAGGFFGCGLATGFTSGADSPGFGSPRFTCCFSTTLSRSLLRRVSGGTSFLPASGGLTICSGNGIFRSCSGGGGGCSGGTSTGLAASGGCAGHLLGRRLGRRFRPGPRLDDPHRQGAVLGEVRNGHRHGGHPQQQQHVDGDGQDDTGRPPGTRMHRLTLASAARTSQPGGSGRGAESCRIVAGQLDRVRRSYRGRYRYRPRMAR